MFLSKKKSLTFFFRFWIRDRIIIVFPDPDMDPLPYKIVDPDPGTDLVFQIVNDQNSTKSLRK